MARRARATPAREIAPAKVFDVGDDVAASRHLLLGRWSVRRAHEADEQVSIEIDDLARCPIAPGDEGVSPWGRPIDDHRALGEAPALRPAALDALGGDHGIGHVKSPPRRMSRDHPRMSRHDLRSCDHGSALGIPTAAPALRSLMVSATIEIGDVWRKTNGLFLWRRRRSRACGCVRVSIDQSPFGPGMRRGISPVS